MAVVERSVELLADLETAWGMLSNAQALSSWLGGDVTVDLRPGGHLSLVRRDGVAVVGNVEEVRPPDRLVFTWWAQRPFGLPRRSRVELTLESRKRSTVLRVREAEVAPPGVTIGPPDAPGSSLDAAGHRLLQAGAGR